MQEKLDAKEKNEQKLTNDIEFWTSWHWSLLAKIELQKAKIEELEKENWLLKIFGTITEDEA